MSAPVDPSVGTQVDTARVGQNVNVTKYITYNNGVKRAFIGVYDGYFLNPALVV